MHLTSHHIRCLKRDLLDDGVVDSSIPTPKSNGQPGVRARILNCGMSTSTQETWAVLAWGAVSSAGLLIGALVGSFFRMSHHAIARAMSVGAGLLLAGVSFKVAADAVRTAGPVAAALSLLLGAALFSVSNALLARFGAAQRKRCGDCIQQLRPAARMPAALDRASGRLPTESRTYIVLMWSAIAIEAVLAIATGYVGFTSLDAAWPPRLQAFGAGALLSMTAETMIPEAFHNSPRFSGLLAAVGFGLLLLIDATAR
jgi:zinc transporter, ZIP family